MEYIIALDFCMLCVGDVIVYFFFFFKQKTAYEMRISDWSSDVCSSDLGETVEGDDAGVYAQAGAVEVENDGTIRGNDTGGIILEQPNSLIDNRGVISGSRLGIVTAEHRDAATGPDEIGSG